MISLLYFKFMIIMLIKYNPNNLNIDKCFTIISKHFNNIFLKNPPQHFEDHQTSRLFSPTSDQIFHLELFSSAICCCQALVACRLFSVFVSVSVLLTLLSVLFAGDLSFASFYLHFKMLHNRAGNFAK